MSELQGKRIMSPEYAIAMRERIMNRTNLALREFNQNNWNLDHNDGFAGLSMQELRRVGLRIASCADVWQVYDILGEYSPTGRCYYDVIIGIQHRRAYDKMEKSLEIFEPNRFEVGLDLGSGTGEMALVLGKKCNHLIAIDLVDSLLGVARRKLKTAKKEGKILDFDIQLMDVLDLRLPEESVDVAIGNGLQAYLTNEERIVMMEHVLRVLKTGGRYYEYEADNPNPPEYMTSQRAFLVGELAATIVGFTLKRQNQEKQNSVQLPGFDITRLRIIDNVYPRKYPEFIAKFVKK